MLQYPVETDLKKAYSAVNLARENSPHFSTTLVSPRNDLIVFHFASKPLVATANFYSGNDQFTGIKTESIRKLSNFNFQWTKTLYQNNLHHIAFGFFSLSRAMNVICYDFTRVFAIPDKFEICFLFGVISYNLVHL